MIVCIGDSITAGQHSPIAWPSLLPGEVVNAGVSGDTTRLGLERFPRDVQDRSPETVIIQFGHNDCNRWETDRGLPRVSPSAFAANLAEMVERCRTFGAEPYLCTLTVSTRSERHRLDTEHYDAIVRRVAQVTNAPIIEVRSAFRDPGLVMADGLHLTEAGHRLFASIVIRDALSKLAA